MVVRGVAGVDGDAEVVGDVELLRGPDVFWAARVDVGAALYVVERGEDEVVFGDGRFLSELLCRGREDDSGLQMDGILFHGFELKRDDGSLGIGGGEAFGLPVLVELYDDLAVEHAVNFRLAGDRDFLWAFWGVERDFSIEEIHTTVEEDR